ncbi:MAG: class I SAM-dependent methyltransferase [Gammaproteobacteria bacterium]
MIEERKDHWEGVYGNKASTEVSWYQAVPEQSLTYLRNTGASQQSSVIDVGGGASTLVDHLLDTGFTDVTVLDLADSALEQTRKRLGDRAASVDWVVGDVTRIDPGRKFDIWHDRAVLHFLTEPADRERYVQTLKGALNKGGHAIISAFGPSGPLKCSGLEIRRYTIEMLQELLGPEFELQEYDFEDHQTPMRSTQQFLYSRWVRRG